VTHLSLFTGIGGLDLAAEWAGFTTVGQCEWADYPTKVLEKHWPDVPRWRDVHDLTAADFTVRTGLATVDCISGGFPCQPHSVAGERGGDADIRDMWPEFRRVVCEIKPRWVVAENVTGVFTSDDGRFFRNILRDFAEMGFDVGWATLSAASVGAIHRRERVAIVANAAELRLEGNIEKTIQRVYTLKKRQDDGSVEEWAGRCSVYQPKLLRKYNGIPFQVERNKCLGNAVVPQQFYPIFKAIAELDGCAVKLIEGGL
jgi:DNA (cytosine-5)-methyltransferase 1